MRTPWLVGLIGLLALLFAGPAFANRIGDGPHQGPTTAHPRPAPKYAKAHAATGQVAAGSACTAPTPAPKAPAASASKRPAPSQLLD